MEVVVVTVKNKKKSDGIFDIPDTPDDKRKKVEDKINHPIAEKFAFVGGGQGGGKICESFWNLGYRRLFVVNTTKQDLDDVNIPDDNKVLFSHAEGGAGKDMSVGEEFALKHKDDIFDNMRNKWGEDLDRCFVVASAGGGTGGGSCNVLIDQCKKYMDYIGKKDKVGVILTLPNITDSKRVQMNAYFLFQSILKRVENKEIATLVVLDNARLHNIFSHEPIGKYWGLVNRYMILPLHMFNILSGSHSPFVTLDRADFRSILDSGCIVFGASKVKDYMSETDISKTLRDRFERGLFSDADLSTSKVAGAILVINDKMKDTIPQGHFDYTFTTVTRLMNDDAMMHQGVYVNNDVKDMLIYSMFGSVEYPKERIENLKAIAGVESANSFYG